MNGGEGGGSQLVRCRPLVPKGWSESIIRLGTKVHGTTVVVVVGGGGSTIGLLVPIDAALWYPAPPPPPDCIGIAYFCQIIKKKHLE